MVPIFVTWEVQVFSKGVKEKKGCIITCEHGYYGERMVEPTRDEVLISNGQRLLIVTNL